MTIGGAESRAIWDNEEMVVCFTIKKYNLDKCEHIEYGCETGYDEGEFPAYKINEGVFPYDKAGLSSNYIFVIEEVGSDIWGKYAVLNKNGKVHYLEIINEWDLNWEMTDISEWDCPANITTDEKPIDIYCSNLHPMVEHAWDNWGSACERDEAFQSWEYNYPELCSLDIIKIQVERKSVPSLLGIEVNPIKNKKGETISFDEWAEEQDPDGENRGLLQICQHWTSLWEKWCEQLNNVEDYYHSTFVANLEKAKRNAHLTTARKVKGDFGISDTTAVMWDAIEKWKENSEALKSWKWEKKGHAKKRKFVEIMDRSKFGTDSEDKVYRAHSFACYFFYLKLRVNEDSRQLLIHLINQLFAPRKSLEFRGGKPDIFGDSDGYKSRPGGLIDGTLPIFIHQEGAGERKITELSSGESNLLIMYFILTSYSDGRIVLIDEPENSMHPEWKDRFIDDLKYITSLRSTQAIVATHSPMILGNHLEDTIELELQQDED